MKTFLKYDKPPLTAMIQCETADECIKKLLTDGVDAFGIQLCVLKREYRDEETLKRIFSACGDKPIYATSYRCKESEGMSDGVNPEFCVKSLRSLQDDIY